MFRRFLSLLLVSLLVLPMMANGARAKQQLEALQNDDVRVLLIYSNENSAESVAVRKLDLLLHHFTKHVRLVADFALTEQMLKDATHVIYYGETERQLNKEVVSLMKGIKKPLIMVGENFEQFSSFNRRMGAILAVNQISQQDSATYFQSSPLLIKPIHVTEEMEVMLYGVKEEERVPLFVQYEDEYALTSSGVLEELVYYYIAEILHEILPNNHADEHLAYLRLEDIHPMSDPKKLKDVAAYLEERGIPYLLVVIPVYITPNTGERVYFADSPELVEVLRELQNKGGTVISHGYTHQYRDSETGEGFEFWDVVNDQFIIESNPNNSIETIRTIDQFPNEEEYRAYIEPLKKKERKYVKKRIKDSIHELASHELYPLAFEAPHYTMSQQGYEIVADYFTSIFGQIQLSDENWEQMSAPPYLSSAHLLRGMALYPETIGYVDGTVEGSMENQKRLNQVLIVRDSVIGGFYHPYLGVEPLPEFLSLYEKVPNLKWIDFKKHSNAVKTSRVQISTEKTGTIHIKNDIARWENIWNHSELSSLEKVLWGLTTIVLLFILLFLAFSFYLRTQVKKRLFKERDTIG
ncbi:hypothetical protein BEP19_02925 [Ammoniphilus oxalaticus]|uniref:DUF2334 domain-containing protein n=1 Tax=Ammoniphilus oxalaticus TaxID=66863 RepID=A0A419SNQ6_9BACL|nr:DUF2334 domain-containing protein [Ammoniphilus oxalaticus]RKD25897.1 hypothetical protein BEP19_02925 [Ammoniphilus oxalaticus]